VLNLVGVLTVLETIFKVVQFISIAFTLPKWYVVHYISYFEILLLNMCILLTTC
jgi:hypothetical protein